MSAVITASKLKYHKVNEIFINPVRLDFASINNEFNVKISNSVKLFLKVNEAKLPNKIWQEGKNIILCVAQSIFPKRNKTQIRWISKEMLEEVENRRKLRAKGIKTKIERTYMQCKIPKLRS